MQKINMFLMFNDQAEEAIKFYTSVFKNSKILSTMDLGHNGEVRVAGGTFELEGQQFMAMNGGPYFRFSEGMSLFINCDTQEEIDELWNKLSEGGEKQQCGWVKDKFGVSWQIVPTALGKMISDPVRSKNVMDAVLKMTKLEIDKLQEAYDSVPA